MEFGGDWTEKKLQIVEDYLRAYLTALKDKPSKDRPFELTYIDAFAGRGYRSERRRDLTIGGLLEGFGDQEEEFLVGSALRAASLEPSFHRYIFIEQSEANAAELRDLIAETPAGKIATVITGDANREIVKLCRSWPRARRAVMFLDPFALQVEWSTITEIAATKCVDMWLLFPLGAVLRLLVKDGKVPEAWGRQLTNCFGTSDWSTRLYRRSGGESDLFGESPELIERATVGEVLAFFNERLGSTFFKAAPNPICLRNSNNAPLFALCFAAGNEKGAPIAMRIAKHLLEKV